MDKKIKKDSYEYDPKQDAIVAGLASLLIHNKLDSAFSYWELMARVRRLILTEMGWRFKNGNLSEAYSEDQFKVLRGIEQATEEADRTNREKDL